MLVQFSFERIREPYVYKVAFKGKGIANVQCLSCTNGDFTV